MTTMWISPWRDLALAAAISMPALTMAVASSPAQACVRVASVAAVDDALADSRLSAPQAARVRSLRDRIAEQVARGDYRAAASSEAQAMSIMGRRFEDYGQVVRGGCTGKWVRGRG